MIKAEFWFLSTYYMTWVPRMKFTYNYLETVQTLLKSLKCEFDTDICAMHKLLNVVKLNSLHPKRNI